MVFIYISCIYYIYHNLQIHEQVLRHGRFFQLGQAVLQSVNIRNIVGELVHPDIASLLKKKKVLC